MYPISIISDKIGRKAGEILPLDVKQSSGTDASSAIDLDKSTHSSTKKGSSNDPWLKVKLNTVYCIQKVERYFENGNIGQTWTCTPFNSLICRGEYCNEYVLTVSYDTHFDPASPAWNCKHGNVVKLSKTDGADEFNVYEIVVSVSRGEIPRYHILVGIMYSDQRSLMIYDELHMRCTHVAQWHSKTF